eukprot:TRINITY_DN9066_c0_g1_i1.p1 TRINITY_DN9066_c0_g1~~TRINITY_DN9066_c0_g1_i1.p1  ORF type:complete len:438 (+),score=47.58 TRINITY_DN9066_c0_g1_i1:94-1407(+)
MTAHSPSSPQLDQLKSDLKARQRSERVVVGPTATFLDDATLDVLTHDLSLMRALTKSFNAVEHVDVVANPTHELEGVFLQLCAAYHGPDRRLKWWYKRRACTDRTLRISSGDVPLPQLRPLLVLDHFDTVLVHEALPLDVINALHVWRDSIPHNNMEWMRRYHNEKSGKHCITYRFQHPTLPWPKASELRPDVVHIRSTSLKKAPTWAKTFFDAPTHQFHEIIIGFSSADAAVVLPVLRAKHLKAGRALTLSPGTFVEKLSLHPRGGQMTVGNSCFNIQMISHSALHRFAEDTRCVMLTFPATDIKTSLNLPSNSMLQHIQMLQLVQLRLPSGSENVLSEFRALLKPFLANFPRLLIATAEMRNRRRSSSVQPLLDYYTICQHGPTLGDFGILLRHEDLERDLSRIPLFHMAAAVADLGVPDAVSHVLLKAVVVMRR